MKYVSILIMFLFITMGCEDKTGKSTENIFEGVGYVEPSYIFNGRLNADTPNAERTFIVNTVSTIRLSVRLPQTGFYVLLRDDTGMIRQYWDSGREDLQLGPGIYTLRFELLDIWMDDVYLTKVWIVPEEIEEEIPTEPIE